MAVRYINLWTCLSQNISLTVFPRTYLENLACHLQSWYNSLLALALHKAYPSWKKEITLLVCMPFQARRTKFTVFSWNHELYNLIKSARKWNSSLNKHERTDIKTTAESWSNSLLKACIVLNKLNKSILHRESIELQTNWAIINWVILSTSQLSTGNHTNKSRPR